MTLLRQVCCVATALVATAWCGAADPPRGSASSEPAKPATRAADQSGEFTVRDVNLYVLSNYGNALNSGTLLRSTLPGFVASRRPVADRKSQNVPSPFGMLTFEGEPHGDLDVLLEFKAGKIFGAWPPCPQKSKRMLWQKAKLTRESGEIRPLPENHWMTPLRDSSRLWFHADRRSEHFVLYDVELPLSSPMKVTLIDGGHGVANVGRFPLRDVTIYKPARDQWLIGQIASLEAAPKQEEKKPDAKDGKADPEAIFDDGKKPGAEKPVAAQPASEAPVAVPTLATEAVAPGGVVIAGGAPTPAAAPGANAAKPDAPAKPEDSLKVVPVKSGPAEGRESILAGWKKRLLELGLGDLEADHLCRQLGQQALRTDMATVVFRLDDEQLEDLFPLEITPNPRRQVRVALVVLLDADPEVATSIDALIKKLGDPSYAEREAAMAALKKLGPAAKQKLQEATSNADVEIAYRAEQLIEQFDNPAGRPGVQE